MKNAKVSLLAVFVGVVMLLCSACGEELPPFLELSSVEAPISTASTERINRYNKHYTASFTPSSEYGELAPFVGGVLEYGAAEAETVKKPVYGLCTVSGAVVVDPVFDNVITHKLNGITIYEILVGSDKRELAEKRLLIPSNGSWMLEIPVTQRVSNISGNGLFAVERDKTVKRNRKKVTITYYDFYSFDGELAFTFDKKMTEAADKKFSLGGFNDELMNVNVTVITETVEKDEEGKDITVTNEDFYAYFVGLSGKKAFEKLELLKAEPFYDGLAVVQSKDGKYGVLKSDGTFLIEPQYNIINRNENEEMFACGTDDYFAIIKNNGDEITKIFCENANIEIIGTENLVYKKTLKYSGKTEFFTLGSNSAFICKETGQFPDAESGKFGIFTCTYSGVTDVFDKSGDSFAQFTDFGKLCGVWGSLAVVEGKNGGVWTLNIENGEKSDRIDGYFTGIANGRYAVVLNNGKYSVYDFSEKVFIAENADFVAESNGVLSAADGGYITLYNPQLSILARYGCETEVPK